jgi:hypothetical protein
MRRYPPTPEKLESGNIEFLLRCLCNDSVLESNVSQAGRRTSPNAPMLYDIDNHDLV